MVGAEVLGHPRLPSNGAVEHPTECDTVDGSGMDAEPNDWAGILIHYDHDDHDPVGPQGGRFRTGTDPNSRDCLSCGQ
jgi:hypothetical protein